MCGYRLACVCAYLCFSSMVGAGQYERYPVPTHPLWSWLNDPWPEDVHAREGERVGGRVAEEGQKRGSGRRKAVGWGTTNKKRWKLQQIKQNERCKRVLSDASVSLWDVSWLDHSLIHQLEELLLSYLFPSIFAAFTHFALFISFIGLIDHS